MNILLIFFALPIAVIIISIALQKILKNPVLVAAIIFAIFLIVTFVVNNLNFLIAAIVYAILSFITAFITCLVGRILKRLVNENSCGCRREDLCSCNNNECNSNNILTIRSLQNSTSNNCSCNQNNNNSNNNQCSYQITSPDGTTSRVNIVSNPNNTYGCCRRR